MPSVLSWRLGLAALLTALQIPASAEVTAFQDNLSLEGVSFAIQAAGQTAPQQLTITTTGTLQPIPPIRRLVDGRVMAAQVADLNGDGQPELYLLAPGERNSGHGALMGYALLNGNRLEPIPLEQNSGPGSSAFQDYRGQDSLAVIEGCLVRRFPLKRTTGSTDGDGRAERQICYELVSRPTGLLLRPAAVMTVTTPQSPR